MMLVDAEMGIGELSNVALGIEEQPHSWTVT